MAPALTGWNSARRLAFLGLFALGCVPPRPAGQPAPPRLLDGGWQTLRAEHRVVVQVHGERRTLRGVIAVARPDRFRLRALGPGGITLFDVAWVGGRVRLVSSLRTAAPGSLLGRLIESVAGDLAAAYDLTPRPADRTSRLEGHAVLREESGRRVHLTKFRSLAGKVYPQEMIIENLRSGYEVQVTAGETVLDEPLDPALFPPDDPGTPAPPSGSG